MLDRARAILGIVLIMLVVLYMPASRTESTNSFAVTENSRVIWSLVWESSFSLENMPALAFQGDQESVQLHSDSQDKLILQIIDLNDSSGEFIAYLGAEGENPFARLKNPRIVFENFHLPILMPQGVNLTRVVESVGLDYLSSVLQFELFEVKRDNDTHSFDLKVGYSQENYLLASLNMTWFDKTVVEIPTLAFRLNNATIKERFSRVPEQIEWAASAILLILGFVVILITRKRS